MNVLLLFKGYLLLSFFLCVNQFCKNRFVINTKLSQQSWSEICCVPTQETSIISWHAENQIEASLSGSLSYQYLECAIQLGSLTGRLQPSFWVCYSEVKCTGCSVKIVYLQPIPRLVTHPYLFQHNATICSVTLIGCSFF